ncbi:MAG: respiratory chain complex I subunit 1 family protein [Vulcanibacillus sp.]
MEYVFSIAIQIILVILIAPLSDGIIKKIKAISQKRKGSSVFQLYYDLWKLFRKDMVISDKSTWIFRMAPYIVFGSSIVAAAFVPVSTIIKVPDFSGDIILVISVLTLGRFFQTLAALDTSSTFGGIGSSREIMISSLFEPALLVAIFTLGLVSKSTSIIGMFQYSEDLGFSVLQPAYLLIFFAIFVVLIAEISRTPVDDPATHLELTMVHEAMVLEYSGRYLALMELGAVIKQLIFITILANIFIPISIEPFTGSNFSLAILLILIYILKVVFISFLLGVSEVLTVKLKLFRVPDLAALSFIASLLAFIQMVIMGR